MGMQDGSAYLGSGGVAGSGASGIFSQGNPTGFLLSINRHYVVGGANVEPVSSGGFQLRAYGKFTSLNRLSVSNIGLVPGRIGKRPVLIPILADNWNYATG